jgi:23S rRNA maturation-related 3'-5' exoribonuclease YhaM
MDGSVTLTVNKSSSVSSQLKHNYGKAIRLIQSKSNHQLSVHIVSKSDLITQVQQALGFGKVMVETASLNNRPTHCIVGIFAVKMMYLVILRSKP